MILFILLTNLLWADYRVYELTISNTTTGEQRQVLSTLDHLQYPTYYPLQPNENIEYTDSWMCFGNYSDFKPYCPNPKASEQE